MTLTLNDLSITRLHYQQVMAGKFRKAAELVSWMGAMQAQDYSMAKWAVGVRLPRSTDKAIQNAIDKGDIIRTHVLRPTWHLVAAKDVRWMLDLTGPHIIGSLKSRHRELELSPTIFKKCFAIFSKALSGGAHLTREELLQILEQRTITTLEQRGAHILLSAELNKLICSGPMRGKKNTYCLFEERVPPGRKISRDEAINSLISRYFQSHGPATLQDFIWWSGLPVADAKRGLEIMRSELESEIVESKTYWFKDAFAEKPVKDSAFLLPAFDEFIISYKDRSACLSNSHHRSTISINGIFRPVILINGRVSGTWKKSVKNGKLTVEMEFFPKEKAHKNEAIRSLLKDASEKVVSFFQRENGE
jgi:hypothetical protein